MHAASQNPQTTAPSVTPPQSAGNSLGWFLLHVGTAGWIGYGAAVKAIEFNPQLLPPPILKSLLWVAQRSSDEAGPFLEWSFRAIIGAEVAIALALLFSTRYARAVAIATLGFFCVILLTAMVQAGMKDGWSEALTGSCGCFGEKGLPASVMLLVDGLLLANALFLVARRRPGGALPVVVALIVGAIATVAIPDREVAAPSPDTTTNTTPSGDGASAPAGPGDATQPTNATAALPWPPAPAQYEKIYFPKWKEWIGKPFRDQKLALAIERPVPADLEQGDWLVTFSRPDCDHCQTMYRTHFSKPRAEKVLKVSILDVMGKPLPMPCVGCAESQVFRVRAGQPGKSPEYLLQTPAVVRLKDGVVVSVCSDIDDPAQVRETLGSPDAPAAASTPPSASATEKPTIPPPPAAPAWPGVPAKLEAFYVAEFADAVGKPLSDNAFARLIQTPVPADFLKGRWIVVFFREDCDHCQELLMSYFTGKLPVRTATIAIPDTDPAASLGNPCEECAKLTLVKGPNYVIGTPVVLAINDGVVECVIENVDDLEALQGCLKFPK